MPATRPVCRRRILPVRLDEATVTSRAVCPCEILPAGLPGLCSINGRTYTMAYNATLPEQGEPIIHGYRLTSTDEYKVYDIPADLSDCSCPDFLFRRGTPTFPACKHILSVLRFREQGKLA